MKFRAAIGMYLQDAQGDGRLNTPKSVSTYLSILNRLADDVENRNPAEIDREDIKRCLRRWPNPSSQSTCRSIMMAFFDWCVEEGYCQSNPVRMTRRPKGRRPRRYRFTLDETLAVVQAASGTRERRAIYLGVYAGLRNSELRGVRGIHFRRPGYIHVSKDIGKGGRERWIPVFKQLEPVVEEIRANVPDDAYVLPALRWHDAPDCTKQRELLMRPSSPQALVSLVQRVAARAGIVAHVGAHTLRHAFTDLARQQTGDVQIVRALLGHASVATTQVYMSEPTLDELTQAIRERISSPPISDAVVEDPRSLIASGVGANDASQPVRSTSRISSLRSVKAWPAYTPGPRLRYDERVSNYEFLKRLGYHEGVPSPHPGKRALERREAAEHA